MTTLRFLPLLLVAVLISGLLPAPAFAANGRFRAGTARIDITPAENATLPLIGYGPRYMEGIHDPLYVRAIVLDDGDTRAAIVVADVCLIWDEFLEEALPPIVKATGIPRDHIMIVATHTHSAPPLGSDPLGRVAEGKEAERAAYLQDVADKMVQAAREAQQNLRPARVGAGQGQSNVNMNRRAQMANGGWWLGLNPDGPSDKTVHVIKLETLSGEPIAILTNYGVHATVMGPGSVLVSGDIAGATARYVEDHYGGKVVAPWTSGTGGDQNPIYSIQSSFGGRIGPVDVLGQILGEETIRVAESIRMTDQVDIRAAQKVVTLPGKKNPSETRYREDLNYQFLDADPVDIRLSLLMIGNIAVTGVSGEVLTMIGQRLKQESPFRETLMMTHCNGSSGYLADDAAYDQISYEIVTTRVKRGYAEDAIVNGLLKLMHQVR